MSKYPYRHNRDELKTLLLQYENLKAGKSHSYIDEEGFEQIIDYFDERDESSKALEAAEYGVNQYPWSAALFLQKANILISLNKYTEALDVLEKAEVLDANDIDLYILKTDAYLALDKQEKAASLLEDAILKFEGEDRLELLFQLADVYDDYENFEKTFDCLVMILKQDPNNEEALYKICFWTDFTGRSEESIRLHQQIIDQFPYNELAWFNLGAAYQGLKLHEKAIDAYLYAVAIDEKFDIAYRNLGDAYLRIRKYDEAIEALQKVLESSRPEAVIYEAIGHCYDKLRNYSQARFHYKKASHLDPKDSRMFYKIACTYMNETAWVQAIKILQQALSIHKTQAEYHIAIGHCFTEIEYFEQAVIHLGIAVKLRPKNLNGWTEFLRTLFIYGMMEEGLKYCEIAFKQTNEKTIFIFYKSMFLFSLGKSKEALLYLENGMAQNPKLFKKFVAFNPAILQLQPVVELAARYKKGKYL